ncbi:hypothetical protein CsSME_00037266 [Camellia sinensis var. sinensis]
MWFSGGRSLIYSSLVVLFLIITTYFSTVGAIRIHPPPPPPPNGVAIAKQTQNDLFQKYFHGRAYDLNNNTTQSGFQDSKRRVPSCPDPLHNK